MIERRNKEGLYFQPNFDYSKASIGLFLMYLKMYEVTTCLGDCSIIMSISETNVSVTDLAAAKVLMNSDQ